jgi:hypothetical protein
VRCRSIVEHTRRIGHDHAAVSRRLKVEVIETNSVVREDLATRACSVEHFAVDCVGQQRDHGVPTSHRFQQLLTRERAIMRIYLDVVELPQIVNCLLRDHACHIYVGPGH